MVSALTNEQVAIIGRTIQRAEKGLLAEVPDRASGNTENHFSLLMKLLTVPATSS
jgi:hypothetical protein